MDNDGGFNRNDFIDTVRIAVRALNDVLDEGIERHPLEEQRKTVRDWRQIGLGIMGLADMLIKIGLTYGTKQAIDLCDKIGFVMAQTALDESALIAAERGAYAQYDDNVLHSSFFKEHATEDNIQHIQQYGLRNSQLLTIAPTGTISTMIGVSGGIEPIFANSYQRMTKSLHNEDVVYKVYTPIVKAYMDKYNIKNEDDLPEYFITSSEISVLGRISMQAIWQKHIDASISSTVNLPHDTTIEQVEELYMEAWRRGLKGITVYRSGCAREGILTTGPQSSNKSTELKRGEVLPASDNLIGLKRKINSGCGSMHIEVFFDPEDGKAKEIYLSKGSTGGCNSFMVGLSRMISTALRAGVDIDAIIDQLQSTVTCPSYATRSATKHDTSKGSSCPMAIGYVLKELQEAFQLKSPQLYQIHAQQEISDTNTPKCPNCGGTLHFEGGCNVCKDCGWSKCE